MIFYHGSDHIISRPLYGKGKADNDYGAGFYGTVDKVKADEWAMVNGSDSAVTNQYEIDTTNLEILKLDQYGTLAWIAEIIANRGARGENAQIIGNQVVNKYKIQTGQADIIIGYRADDSYIDVVDAFLRNELTIDEVDRMFRKGNLGRQIFIQSQRAFDRIVFKGYENINSEQKYSETEVKARIEVSKFLHNRSSQIALNGYQPIGLTASEVIQNNYYFDQTCQYYLPGEDPQFKTKKEEEDGYGR